MSGIDRFADLKVHSSYSYRDGIGSVEEQVARAAELGRPAIALTDHATGAGFIELQEAADKVGIQPIFGVDMPLFWPDDVALINSGGDWAREGCGAEAERQATNGKTARCSSLTLLAVDEQGLQNLLYLLTWAGTDGYDLNAGEGPRLREDVLLAHSEGLAVLSGGAGGLISQLLEAGRVEVATLVGQRYRQSFGSNFYLEVEAGQSELASAERVRLVKFAREQALPLLATSNVHYLQASQAIGRDLLWAIADNVRLNDPQRRKAVSDKQYPLSRDELNRIFSDIPDALENAANLAARCQARFPKSGLIIPDFAVPSEYSGYSSPAAKYLAVLAQQNLETRYGRPLNQAMQTRLDYELGVIEQSGFSQYILIVADLVQQTQKMDILCAPRGSSAGSLVCFAVGITPLNPLDYGLLFERFLNPSRLAPPDIDLDIADEARPRLLDYVVRHYGAANVAHIATHSMEGAKSALRDVGKALGSDPFLVNRLSALIPIEFQRPWTLARTIAEEPETVRLYQNDAAARTLLDAARSIEGTGRNLGTHAAGVVITPRPTAKYVPLIRTQGLGQEYRARPQNVAENDDPNQETGDFLAPTTMTQWDMDGVEKRGLLKMDLLGLTAWSTIGHCLDFIQQRTGQKLEVWRLPTDDAATYRSIAQGYTIGIFQLEKQGMTEFAMNMRPQNISDLALLIAAYRPGPMPFLGQIMAVRNGHQSLKTPHPLVTPILAESYGAPVYQETMLKLARDIAGFSLGEADTLRKAIGKKNERELVGLRARFMDGALAHGLSPDQAAEIWEMFPPFAFYGFNQAHAIVYGHVTYITAYLKANYPLEYLGGLLRVAGSDSEAVAKAASECRRLNVALLGPDINYSAAKLSLDSLPDGTPALRLGLAMIKGLGPAGLDAIMMARRESGPFQGLADFIRRVPGRAVNARTLAALAKVGAFPFGNRAQIEASIPNAQKAAKAKNLTEPMLEPASENSLTQMLADEYQLLGVHLTPVPIIPTVKRLHDEQRIDTFTNELSSDGESVNTKRSERKTVRLGGALTGGREVKSMYGQMFSFMLDDGRGLLEVSVFPKLYKQYATLLKEGQLLVVEGQVQFNEGRPRLSVSKLEAA